MRVGVRAEFSDMNTKIIARFALLWIGVYVTILTPAPLWAQSALSLHDASHTESGTSADTPTTRAGQRGLACNACDANCDGLSNGADVQPFVAAMASGWSAGCSSCAGDFDGNGTVSTFDVAMFVICLLGGDVPQVSGGCLHIIGTDDGESLALRLRPGNPNILDVDLRADDLTDFSFDRELFSCIQIETRGGEDVVWIDESNGVFTDAEITTIDGGTENDLLIGGSGDETFIGGDGMDTIVMAGGNDRFIWNPGDATDIVDGGNGFDTVEINGDAGGEDFTVTANGTRVRFDRINFSQFFLDIGTCEYLILNANAGNDTLACTGNLAALIQITADGGPGADTLLGGNGPDLLIGGDDDDFIDGNQGADTIRLGAGNDRFQWDPGDGNDTIEGQAGNDVILFNGSNANETYEFSNNASRLRFTRDVANITLDADGIEEFELRAFGGTDTINVSDLTGTALTQVNVDLAGSFGGNAGDGLADNVTLVGTSAADVFNVSADSGYVVVPRGADIRVRGYEAADQVVFNGVGGDVVIVNGTEASDTVTITANGTQARVDANGYSAAVGVSGALSLVVNALGGNDMVSCTGNLAAIIPITIDGGAGNDTLLGGNGADILIGGDDNDFIDGNQGADTILMGQGDDTFQWDPGDGNDTVEGQAGHDVVRFNGSNISEVFDFSANGARLRFTRNIGSIVFDADGIEQFDLRAVGGSDMMTVNSLAGTSVDQINMDLAATIGGTSGDAQPDSIIVNGTDLPDAINVAPNAGAVEVSGLPATIRIFRSEQLTDSLTVNGLAGDDSITSDPGVSAMITLTSNP